MLSNRNKKSFTHTVIDQKIFNAILTTNLLIFLFDAGMWLFAGNPVWLMRTANYLATLLFYLTTPIIAILWLMYTDFKIYENRAGLLKRLHFYVIPAVVCVVMTLISPFTGWFFIINNENRYFRGPLFPVLIVILFTYLVLSCGMSLYDIVKNGWEANKSVNLPLMIYPIIVAGAAFVQMINPNGTIIWVCTMLVCTSIYINIQNEEIYTDYLTGLYNRRRLDQYFNRKINTRRGDRTLFVMVFDLDEFKKINDLFGHASGDDALVRTAELLRKSCKCKEDFIARTGGDEFLIVGERSAPGEIQRLIETITENIADFNKKQCAKYTLMLSMGYAVLGENGTEDDLLAAADKEMYQCKMQKKAAAAGTDIDTSKEQIMGR